MSQVWKHFYLDEDDESKAICNICNTKLIRGIGKQASTSSLWKHLKYKHSHILKECGQTEVPSTSSRNSRQLTISESLTNTWKIDDQRAREIHKLIGEMIALDNQPFSIVENTGFRRLLARLEKKYKIPSRPYFSQRIIPEIYEKCRTRINELLSDANDISFTTDMWTSSVNNKSFISLTAHWVNKNFEQKHCILNVRGLDGSHTGENIMQSLDSLLQESDIQKERVHLFLRDSGANIKKATKNMQVNNEACFIHSQQLIVISALKVQRAVSDVISIGRGIVTYLNHSSPARMKLEEIQKQINNPVKKLIQDVPTRWNSTFYLLERLVEQKRAISLLAIENQAVSSFSCNQWDIAEKLLELLQPFEQTTKHFSSTQCTISEVIPTVFSLKRFLRETKVPGLGSMQEYLLEGLNQRFSDIETNNNYMIATFVDPRFKDAFCTEKDEFKNNVLKYIHEALIQNAEVEVNMSSSSDSEDDVPLSLYKGLNTEIPSSSKRPREDKRSFWDVFASIATTRDTNKKSSAKRPNVQQDVQNEISSYLALPLIDRQSSPFSWWKQNSERFPKLAKLAKKFLSAPASTIFSERLFSEAGNIYEDTRNRLLSENGEMLVYLHHNLPLIDFTY